MKILLDENIPHDLRRFLVGHEAFTTSFMGWSGVENGALLKKAVENGFGAMITKDSGVAYEQSTSSLPVTVVILKAKTNKLDDIQPLIPALMEALNHLPEKAIVRIGSGS